MVRVGTLSNMTHTKLLSGVSKTLLKGRITELNCLTYLLEKGYIVSVPEVPCSYDLIVDTGNNLYKIQVKSAVIENDEKICIKTHSLSHNTTGYTKRVYSENEVDFFGTYYNGVCYLVPFNKCGNRVKKLRLVPTKNGQVKNVSFAKDYIAEDILSK